MRYQNYNWSKGWEGTNHGWHEVVINNANFDGYHSPTKFEEKYQVSSLCLKPLRLVNI
jgi:hypothetical protein